MRGKGNLVDAGHKRLIARYLAGEDVSRQLLTACRRDRRVLAGLADQVVLERALRVTAAEDDEADFFAQEVRRRIAGEDDADLFARNVIDTIRVAGGSRRARLVRRLLLAAAVVLAIVSACFLFPSGAPVARIGKSVDAVWETGLAEGDPCRRGEVVLREGYAEMHMGGGAVLLLEGPARLQLLSPGRVALKTGTLVARVPRRARGFRLDTPSSAVIDLGTEFGVSVTDDGRSELHVLQGMVRARPRAGGTYTDIGEDQARAFVPAGGRMRTIRLSPHKFLRELPGRSAAPPHCVHWSFDEENGETAVDSGSFGEKYPAVLRTLDDGGTRPLRVNGQYGRGLYFNGRTSYAMTEFPGIGGNAPRTVVFWVKVPAPEEMRPVFGLVSWGSMKNVGSAWQISINPWERDGPLGRLRVGTRQAQVVGTTDLRDDRWHHLAVVMYGGRAADVSTHILLYVDGQLEKTSKKSVHRIYTDITGREARTVMLGRNMTYSLDDEKVPNRLFKGWLDEVYIFDAALTREQIRRLMTGNRPPG